MPTPATQSPPPADEFGEKEFYLDEFRTHTLCFAVRVADCERAGFEVLGEIARELIANETRVIILLGVPAPGRDARTCLQRARRQLQRLVLAEETQARFPIVRGRRTLTESFVDLTAEHKPDLTSKLDAVWPILRTRPLLVGAVEDAALVDSAQRLCGRLRVHKLVIVEPLGGLSSPETGQLSFMDDAMLSAALHAGEAEWTGLARRRATLEEIGAALRGGVHSVNLCSLDGLARELYTYEGSGTLFTLEDYCRVERLGIDDFEEVERLLARGQREGYLKLRGPKDTARILLNGYGATIGAHHLAGVCALETESYRAEQVGEIVGLYTITRFKGEGVGGRLVARLLADADASGLRYVFACTVEPRAQAFFERHGFDSVSPADVPAAKWVGYDAARLARLKVYRRDCRPHGAVIAAG